MKLRVLVVDDSAFFRRRIAELIDSDPGLEVIGTAADGREAVQKVAELRPDVVTMDIEMPVMDGISAVREIMQRHPLPILMFSSLTREGARPTLDALEAGAMDYLPKRLDEMAARREDAVHILCQKLRALGRRPPRPVTTTRPAPAAAAPAGTAGATAGARAIPRPGQIRLVAIGASTGGPVALQRVLTRLPADFPAPVLVIQHMPGTFTPAFAQRLDGLCRLRVKEAQDGESIGRGTVYIAPGGRQMLVRRQGAGGRITITEGSEDLNYKPCVDVTFRSLAIGNSAEVLAILLTGMGADGCEGARALKEGGATVWAQDEASSVVWGMPAAVVRAGLADAVLPLDRIGPTLAEVQ
ncbi:MAG: chemotaxis response regulator protein-glutamate methylesterase [Gammaproteobacteria bacterium]|nr:MAG: chemotaxis response regulator protein-glutamate methylesterase [Gammaproteobacteria bacterium]